MIGLSILISAIVPTIASAKVSLDNAFSAPSNSVVVDPLSFAVFGANGPFRNSSSDLFNPTNSTPPFFQVFDQTFLNILGHTPSIRVMSENDSFAFAHEAPIYAPTTDEVFFSSNEGSPQAFSDINHNNQVSKISLKDAEKGGLVNYTKVPLSNDLQMTNGGTPFKGNLLFVNAGRGPLPANVVLVNPLPPYNDTVLLDNFFGRQFNSINDVKIHPTSKVIFFTDTSYGYLLNFKPLPLLPNQVYRFDPDTGDVRVVADGFIRPNGLAFSPDGETAYVTDTAEAGGFLGTNQTLPATIYAYDVDSKSQAFKNRRVFAYIDTGIPDGIELDSEGNIYAACGDGVHVWDPTGRLLGKIFLGVTVANFVFVGEGRVVILADTKVFLVQIDAEGILVF